MDKSVGRDKRRKDKQYKKPPPVKSSSSSSAGKPKKEAPSTNPTPVPTSPPLIVYDDPYSKRPIESNWNSSRNLSSGESDSEDNQLRAADFEKLLQMPPSVSGHFFLSTEKHWATDSEEASIAVAGGKSGQQYGQYFQIDTKQLNTSLATIPFYERNEYPCEIFSKHEIDSMKVKAQLESKKYDELCQRLESSKKMGDNQPKPPIKCLIGAGAMPPPVGQERPSVPPARPPPCLMGPMSLPPELRNDPNVTGSYASSNIGVAERMSEVLHLSEGASRSSGDAVPIGSDNVQENRETSDGEARNEGISGAVKGETKSTAKETKEDIQQWLDDILDM